MYIARASGLERTALMHSCMLGKYIVPELSLAEAGHPADLGYLANRNAVQETIERVTASCDFCIRVLIL